MTLSGQGWLFLSTVLLGAIIGLFYDVFRVFRKVAVHKGWAVQLEDILFWTCATAAMFYFMLNRNNGEIRLVYMVGAACGATLYFATISHMVRKVAVAVINFIKRVVITAVRIITFPLRLFFKMLMPPAKFLVSIFNKWRKSLRNAARYGKIKKTMRNWFILRKKV